MINELKSNDKEQKDVTNKQDLKYIDKLNNLLIVLTDGNNELQTMLNELHNENL